MGDERCLEPRPNHPEFPDSSIPARPQGSG